MSFQETISVQNAYFFFVDLMARVTGFRTAIIWRMYNNGASFSFFLHVVFFFFTSASVTAPGKGLVP